MSKIGRCDACLHFASQGSPIKEFGMCTLAESEHGKLVRVPTLAFASDHEAYSAVLFVRPNFGCIQFADGGPNKSIYEVGERVLSLTEIRHSETTVFAEGTIFEVFRIERTGSLLLYALLAPNGDDVVSLPEQELAKITRSLRPSRSKDSISPAF